MTTAYCPHCSTLEPFTVISEPQVSVIARLEFSVNGGRLVYVELACGHTTRIVTKAEHAA